MIFFLLLQFWFSRCVKCMIWAPCTVSAAITALCTCHKRRNIQSFSLQTTGLKVLSESAIKASISSTVRGTQVRSSTPVPVTAMSSSIRTYKQQRPSGKYTSRAEADDNTDPGSAANFFLVKGSFFSSPPLSKCLLSVLDF